MRANRILITMGLLFSLLGCAQKNNLIELTSHQDSSEGWKDLVFSITSKEKIENGFWSLTCKAKYDRDIVGIKINILDGIPAGIVNDKINNASIRVDAVEIISIGEESDRFLEAISNLYGQPKKSLFTSEKLTFTVFSLNTEKAVLENGRYHFKLFFDDNNERDLYSELFLNPDLKSGYVEFNEKDEEYRRNIVKLLSED